MKHKAIVVQDLRKYYTKGDTVHCALDGITMSIDDGDFVGLLGENGAGKSTMINILSSAIKKTSGKVKIFGTDISRNALSAKYKIGVVHQELGLDPFLTVYESLQFHSLYYGIWPNKKYIGDLLDAIGLAKQANASPRQLSGGMRRRVLIAKALVHDPDIIILDEPSAGVDLDLRKRLFSYINFLHRERNKTILLTTHYLEEVQELCHKVAVIKCGKLVKYDTTNNIITKAGCRNAFVKIAMSDMYKVVELTHPTWCKFDKCLGIFDFEYTVERLSQLVMSLHDLHVCVDDIRITEPNLARALDEAMYG